MHARLLRLCVAVIVFPHIVVFLSKEQYHKSKAKNSNFLITMVAEVALGGRKRLAPMMYFPGDRVNAASALDLSCIMQQRMEGVLLLTC